MSHKPWCPFHCPPPLLPATTKNNQAHKTPLHCRVSPSSGATAVAALAVASSPSMVDTKFSICIWRRVPDREVSQLSFRLASWKNWFHLPAFPGQKAAQQNPRQSRAGEALELLAGGMALVLTPLGKRGIGFGLIPGGTACTESLGALLGLGFPRWVVYIHQNEGGHWTQYKRGGCYLG